MAVWSTACDLEARHHTDETTRDAGGRSSNALSMKLVYQYEKLGVEPTVMQRGPILQIHCQPLLKARPRSTPSIHSM
jgi:hypothetical protein